MSKNLYLIRHGHSLHNELFDKMGVKAFRIPVTIDSPLTGEGHLQSIELGHTWKKKNIIDCRKHSNKYEDFSFFKIYRQ